MTHTNGLDNVETLINRFGGMRPMARKVNVPVSTIQGWKKRDHIPSDRVTDVIKAAQSNNISLDGFDISNENTKIETHTPETSSIEDEKQTNHRPSAVRPQNTQAASQKHVLDAGQIKRDVVKRSVITTVSILALFGGLGYLLFGQEAKQIASVATDQSQMQTRLNSFEKTVTEGLNSLNDQVTGLTNQTMPLKARIANLESKLRTDSGEIDLGMLVSRFENLSQTIAGEGGDTAQAFADMKSVVNSLQGRIDSLDIALNEAKADNAELAKSMNNVTGRDLSAAAMLLALTQMRDSLNRSEPFDNDLAILQELVGNDDPELTTAINRLAPYAQSGVLTPEGLSSELRGVTGEIIAAAIRGDDVSVKNKIMARVGQILSVEKDGEPLVGIKEQAVVARAQDALDRGDVKSALRELQSLEGEAANAANPITQELQNTLNADQTVSMMMQKLLKKLQSPQDLKTMIQNLPAEIKRQTQGNLVQDDASGIIILDQ